MNPVTSERNTGRGARWINPVRTMSHTETCDENALRQIDDAALYRAKGCGRDRYEVDATLACARNEQAA